MSEALADKSGIWFLKSKFFLIRIVSYFFFLLFPVWIQKTINLNDASLSAMMVLYIMFMVGQWFLLGKEIDYRLKIYFRVNSSMDRVIYRLFLGMFFMVLYFNLLSFLPSKWIYNTFWTTWVFLGLFYSWPTRGKIIKESVSTNFGEFKYLDSFEKTLLLLAMILFIFSVPEMPKIDTFSDLRTYFDPNNKISKGLWNFLLVNYYPFKNYPNLFRIAISMHFYLVGLGVFLVNFYALLRFFVSRRLSLLGVFAVISSWSFSKILVGHYGDALLSTYSLLWIWTIFWVAKSATYRSGLFLGLIGFFGVLIDSTYFFLLIIQLIILFVFLLREKTTWYKRQLLKYSLFGIVLALGFFIASPGVMDSLQFEVKKIFLEIESVLSRKAFFTLSVLGLILIMVRKLIENRTTLFDSLKIDGQNSRQLIIFVTIIFCHSVFFDSRIFHGFSLMWIMALLSLFPIEMLFQNISRLRSKRNMIYLIYILICILDSHFEGRVKIFLRLF